MKNENRWPNRLWDETPAVAGVGSIQKRQQSAPPYYVFSSTLPLTNPTYLFCYPSTSPPLFALKPPTGRRRPGAGGGGGGARGRGGGGGGGDRGGERGRKERRRKEREEEINKMKN